MQSSPSGVDVHPQIVVQVQQRQQEHHDAAKFSHLSRCPVTFTGSSCDTGVKRAHLSLDLLHFQKLLPQRCVDATTQAELPVFRRKSCRSFFVFFRAAQRGLSAFGLHYHNYIMFTHTHIGNNWQGSVSTTCSGSALCDSQAAGVSHFILLCCAAHDLASRQSEAPPLREPTAHVPENRKPGLFFFFFSNMCWNFLLQTHFDSVKNQASL